MRTFLIIIAASLFIIMSIIESSVQYAADGCILAGIGIILQKLEEKENP